MRCAVRKLEVLLHVFLKMAGVSLPISSSKLLKSRGEAIKGLTMLAYIFFKELIVKKTSSPDFSPDTPLSLTGSSFVPVNSLQPYDAFSCQRGSDVR
jgi:hypothetical protein